MTGRVGNKGQKGENGKAIFPFLFSFISRWRRHVERSETSVGSINKFFIFAL